MFWTAAVLLVRMVHTNIRGSETLQNITSTTPPNIRLWVLSCRNTASPTPTSNPRPLVPLLVYDMQRNANACNSLKQGRHTLTQSCQDKFQRRPCKKE